MVQGENKQDEQKEREESGLQVCEVKEYVDIVTNRRLTELTPCDISDKLMAHPLNHSEKRIFQGGLPVKNGEMNLHFPFGFPPGMTMQECWERFDEIGKEALNQYMIEKARSEKSKIIVPGKF